ncbi:MAG: DNA repair protein RadA [Bacillota bacterium]
MVKSKTRFVCQQCGHDSPKWLGKCPGCGEWNSLAEEQCRPREQRIEGRETVQPVLLADVVPDAVQRFSTGIGELDRVLGGGVIPGALVLVGGDPGIGKSTLLLQAACRVSEAGNSVLYVTGEESREQIRYRAERLRAVGSGLLVLAESSLEEVIKVISTMRPGLVIIDSIQTMFSGELASAPGSVAQVRESAARLMTVGKTLHIPMVLVGHVTKDGNLAGPRVLEHMVDTVLYFEGERHHAFRILRAVKNRFGSTNEIGVFEMTGLGLREVINPSEVFLSQKSVSAPGSVVVASLEGSRPVLLEVQALVTGNSYPNPRRLVTGLDWNRVLLMIAVMDKRLGYNLGAFDVFVNVAGGVHIEEPAADLGICLALASSLKNRPVPEDIVAMGEVGLTGEVRSVSSLEMRVKEAAKLGFKRCIVPKNNGLQDPCGKMILLVRTVEEAVEAALAG